MKKRKHEIWISLGMAGGFLGSFQVAASLAGKIGYVDVIRVYGNLGIFIVIVIYILLFSIRKFRLNALWLLLPYILSVFIPFLFKEYRLIYSAWSLIFTLSMSMIAIFAYIWYDWNHTLRREKELENQNLQSELAFLKNQINPHFLFNSLNNIDSLINSNPDKASAYLIRLSDMMRYMLYETDVQKVLLAKELDYIKNFIGLQKMQYANKHLVTFDIVGDPCNIMVPPMLFVPFVENAFKHCSDKNKENAIRFTFGINANEIRFTATNVYVENSVYSEETTGGVGLDVVKRRLELLYPDKYILDIEQKNSLFCVDLVLKIND